MNKHSADRLDRRRFITQLASGILVSTLSAEAFADELVKTPWATEGPFYPYGKLPLDKDNDLVIVGKNTTSAVGTITHIAGRILDAKGSPVRNAEIEIWQVDGKGVYLAQANQDGADRNFQGWGKFVTNAKGEYRFRTIKPVPYPGRSAPHIHVKVTAPGGRGFTTQLFIKGHPGNMQDNIYGSIRDAAGRASVTKDFAPVKGSKIGECAVQFDIVLGATAEEQEHDNFGRRPPRGRRGGRPPGPPPGGFGETPPPGGFGRPPFD